MKKQFQLLKILTGLTLPLNGSVLFACSKATQTEPSIAKKCLFTSTRDQNIQISIPDESITSIEVQIINSDSKAISLASRKIDVINQFANVKVLLSYEWIKQCDAHFDLEVKFFNVENNLKLYKIFTNLEIIFSGQKPSFIDEVWFPKTSEILNGTYETTFTLNFYEEINSDVNVELFDSKNTLILKNSTAKVEKDERPGYKLWHANIVVDVPLNQCVTELFDFSLKITFKNSFGIIQTNTFDNLCIKYVRYGTIFPVEYLNIVDNEILSIKKEASITRMIEDCECVVIPEGITKISKNAFSMEETSGQYRSIGFTHVRKIVIPNTVKTIEQGAFYGFHNLFELDLSTWKLTTPPEWLTNASDLFNTSTLSVKYGYIWLNNEEIGQQFDELFKKIGLPETWLSVSQSLVVPDYYYNYEITNANGQQNKVITGIKDKYLDSLWQYKIIKIADDVNEISQYAFINSFGKYPYFKEKRSTQLWTRRLILGRNLKKLNSYAFASSGIGGPVFIPNEVILNNPQYLLNTGNFKNIGKYTDSLFGDQFNTEPVQLIFDDNITNFIKIPASFCSIDRDLWGSKPCDIVNIHLPRNISTIDTEAFDINGYAQPLDLPNSLEAIEDMAFYTCNCPGTLTLGPNLWKIGENAFGLHKFEKIVFNCFYTEGDKRYTKLTTIGEYAFGCDKANKTVNTIDLSMYNSSIYLKDQQITGVPEWMTNNNHIFDNACADSGKVLVSDYVYNNADLLKKYKEKLQELGVPSNWTFEVA